MLMNLSFCKSNFVLFDRFDVLLFFCLFDLIRLYLKTKSILSVGI